MALISGWVGQLYEKVQHEAFESNDIDQEFADYLILFTKRKTEEQAKALVEWESKMIVESGSNATIIVKIVRVARATEVRIQERKKLQVFKKSEAACG